MWIEIKKDIFENADFKGLNFILQLLTWYPTNSIPRYNLFVDWEKINHLDNYNQLSELDKKVIETEFNDAITNDVFDGRYIITNNNKSQSHNRLNIEEAIMFLNQPVNIVLENSLNDSYFLNAIFYYFDKKLDGDKQRLVEFVKNNWVQFVNAGGWTNINNYIKGQLKSYDYLSAINQKENYSYLRCFVMMDSDKEYPSQVMQDKENLKDELEKQNIKVHILKKRAMENYMPDEVMQDIPNLRTSFRRFRAWVEVYSSLSSEQKDFLNYKNGFSKKKIEQRVEKVVNRKKQTIIQMNHVNKERVEQDIEIQNLYPHSNLSHSDYEILDDGLQLPSFKDYFPSLFENNPLVHKTSLLAREGGTETNNEFLEIIEKINELI